MDPRDLLRGDYVILSYKISDVALDLFTPPRPTSLAPGQTIYVALEPRGQFHEAVRASTDPIRPAAGQVVLKGHKRAWGDAAASTVRIEYGLERYYVREGTGNPRGKLTVQVAVPSSGQGRIKEVLVDGKPYAQAMKDVAR